MAQSRMTILFAAVLLPGLGLAADIKGIAIGMAAADVKARHPALHCSVSPREPAVEACGAFRKGVRGLGELDTYAGEKVEDFFVFFNAGLVRRVRVNMASSAFMVVTTALTEKYGPPDSSETSVVQNRMGAKFDQEEKAWKHSGDRIEAKRRSSTLTQMQVELFNEADLVREVEELKSKAKGAAKDL